MFCVCVLMLVGLVARLVRLMVYEADYYQELAEDLHQRERSIKAARGRILDRNGTVLASNRTVCTVSVVHSQMTGIRRVSSRPYPGNWICRRRRCEKGWRNTAPSSVSRQMWIKRPATASGLWSLRRVKIDEDYKRSYPYGSLASKVLGFTGSDNQGIIGLEVRYDTYLQGQNGTILTLTDARGIELADAGEERVEPVPGADLRVSLDYNIQLYAEQAAKKVREEKQATYVSILVLNPRNGEIYANVNVPEFDLNNPYDLTDYLAGTDQDPAALTEEQKQDLRNQMWRNQSINDTYEPGSIFKIVTAAAALEKGVVSLQDRFSCPGFRMVEDRRIRCHKVQGHGSETFVQAIENSCNPAFIDIGQRVGAEDFCGYFRQFGLMEKTGIDLPGEANIIMHKLENIGLVELATMSFGQSFQITPMQMAATVSSIVNGGRRITPHFGVAIENQEGKVLKKLSWPKGKQVVRPETSETMRFLLEKVVSEGGGKKAYIEGYRIGGKTATSQTLPRGTNKLHFLLHRLCPGG